MKSETASQKSKICFPDSRSWGGAAVGYAEDSREDPQTKHQYISFVPTTRTHHKTQAARQKHEKHLQWLSVDWSKHLAAIKVMTSTKTYKTSSHSDS